ncbi:hypothetical protein COY95_00695, partial [Candidatus Woesearchaeota archaeon CG_4_10_14_0_8_um_filter_47_5]
MIPYVHVCTKRGVRRVEGIMGKLKEIKKKILAVSCLKAMKESLTYRRLSADLHLPIGVLSRYVNGYVLPKAKRAEEIIDYFDRTFFNQRIQELGVHEDSKYFVTRHILASPFLLDIIAHKIQDKFPQKIHAVLTAAVGGIPLATKTADTLGAALLVAKQSQEVSPLGFYTSRHTTTEKPVLRPYFLSKDLVRKNKRVLIVDDVVRAGTTISLLADIAHQARLEIVGVYCIFIVQPAYDRL